MSLRIGLNALGLVIPLGMGKAAVSRALFDGDRSGLVARDDLIDGRIIHVGAATDDLPPVPAPLARFSSRNNRLMLAALDEIAGDIAAARAEYGADRIAVVLGTSTSGIAESETAFREFRQTATWPAGFTYDIHEAGGLAEFAADALGLTGPAYAIATACSSSAKVFAAARRLIHAGICDAAIVGGSDSLCRMTLNGFDALGALSPGLCNPFSRNRDGINIGEGAVAFLMSRKPGPVDLLGCGESCDAYHISAPEPDGIGAMAAMAGAVDDAGIAAADIAYINLHGTGTELNDRMESRAVHTLFGGVTPCSSTKALTGHTLGAAGAVEAAFLWLALHPGYGNGRLPPHVWDGAVDPDLAPIELASRDACADLARRPAMLSSSFAFGGNNVALVLGRPAA